MKYKCRNCGHYEDEHWQGWAECDQCSCMLFELGEAVEEEDTTIEVLTFNENGV